MRIWAAAMDGISGTALGIRRVYANYMRDVNSGTPGGYHRAGTRRTEKWKSGYYNPETGEDYRGYDWYHNYVRSAAPQYYANANLSGGSEKVTYYASLSHVGQEAVFQDYTFNRTNLQTNVDVNITDNLKFGTQISGKIDNTINPGLPGSDDYEARKLSVIGMLPIYRPYANDNEQYVNYIAGYDGAHNPASYTIDNAGEYHKRNTTFQTNFTLGGKRLYRACLLVRCSPISITGRTSITRRKHGRNTPTTPSIKPTTWRMPRPIHGWNAPVPQQTTLPGKHSSVMTIPFPDIMCRLP